MEQTVKKKINLLISSEKYQEFGKEYWKIIPLLLSDKNIDMSEKYGSMMTLLIFKFEY